MQNYDSECLHMFNRISDNDSKTPTQALEQLDTCLHSHSQKKSPHFKTLHKSLKKISPQYVFFILLIRSYFLCFVLIFDQDASEHKPICSVCKALSLYSFLPFFLSVCLFTYFPVKYNNVDFSTFCINAIFVSIYYFPTFIVNIRYFGQKFCLSKTSHFSFLIISS